MVVALFADPLQSTRVICGDLAKFQPLPPTRLRPPIFSRFPVLRRAFFQVSIALAVASTSIVPSSMRGKLSGLYNTAESIGRFSSAAGFPVLFAWSISPLSSGYHWVDHCFVFYVFALALTSVTMLARWTITPDLFRS